MSAAEGAALVGRVLLQQEIGRCHAELDEGAAAWLYKGASATVSSPPVRLYLHALCVEDITIQSVLRNRAPLYTSLLPILGNPADVALVRHYARAVYSSTDAYLAGLSSDALSRVVDLSRFELGRRTVAWVIRRFVIVELTRMQIAISAASLN